MRRMFHRNKPPSNIRLKQADQHYNGFRPRGRARRLEPVIGAAFDDAFSFRCRDIYPFAQPGSVSPLSTGGFVGFSVVGVDTPPPPELEPPSSAVVAQQ